MFQRCNRTDQARIQKPVSDPHTVQKDLSRSPFLRPVRQNQLACGEARERLSEGFDNDFSLCTVPR
jgi:hypothetical protein